MPNGMDDMFQSMLEGGRNGIASEREDEEEAVSAPDGEELLKAHEIAAAELATEKAQLSIELDGVKAELEKLRKEKAALEESLANASLELRKANDRNLTFSNELAKLRAEKEEKAANDDATMEKDKEIARLNALLTEAKCNTLSSSVMLVRPANFQEKFTGEVRDHVLAALKDALAAAESGGRDRRASILESVLCANQSSGQLDYLRDIVKRIMKESGSVIDDRTIIGLTKCGFRYVSGKNHHKFDWAGIRITVSKTPGDHRADDNTAALLLNKAF